MADNTTLPSRPAHNSSNEENFVLPDEEGSVFEDGKWVPISDLSYRINWFHANIRAEAVVEGLKKICYTFCAHVHGQDMHGQPVRTITDDLSA